MEPRKAELKKTQENPAEERTIRFQIVKLEERIAPNRNTCEPFGCCHGNGRKACP